MAIVSMENPKATSQMPNAKCQMPEDKETIAALATPPGEGGVGMLRISGARAREILGQMFVPSRPLREWRSHQLVLGTCHGASGELLDEVLATWMAHGRSYTGEEVVEIHGHGGQLNMLQLLRRAIALGARIAGPGEFTRRAFLNGRIDLTKAEAIVDLIGAKNEQALRIARDHLQGQLKARLEALAERSLMLAAQVESWIDFPEEFDPAMEASVAALLDDARAFEAELRGLLDSYAQGRQLKEGWSVLLVGRPNAGKSSLFNRLHGRQRAIVTDVPGTTRDLLEAELALGGIQLTLTDSAGLRAIEEAGLDGAQPHDAIERIGVGMALEAAQRAHLRLAVFDLSRPAGPEDQQVVSVCLGHPTCLILNKSDLPRRLEPAAYAPLAEEAVAVCAVSCESGDGIPALLEAMRTYMVAQTPAGELMITNERQRDALARALDAVGHALSVGLSLGPEFVAEDLRAARRALAAITGAISSEDVLSAIFTRFCIGK